MNNDTKQNVLKLANECRIYMDAATYPANARELEAFYRAAFNAGIEAAAVAAWSHYSNVCKSKGINPHHNGEWIASTAIRELEMK